MKHFRQQPHDSRAEVQDVEEDLRLACSDMIECIDDPERRPFVNALKIRLILSGLDAALSRPGIPQGASSDV